MPETTGSRQAEPLLVIAIVALASAYVASIGPYWNISPDSATYVGRAQALASGTGMPMSGGEPPMASLVFAVVLLVAPQGYVGLNALTQLLTLGSLGLAYALLRRRGSALDALLTILLCLGSVRLYDASTQLLSGPVYLACSLGALLLLDRGTASAPTPDGSPARQFRPAEWAAGMLVIAAVLTRAIGLALPLAILVVEGLARARGRRPRLVPVAFAMVAAAAAVFWELQAPGRSYLGGWFRMFLGGDPWAATPAGGDAPLTTLLARLAENLPLVPAAGRLLLNTWSPGSQALALLLQGAGTAVVVLGAWRALRPRLTVLPVYVLLYLLVVAAHMLYGGDGDLRFLLPILPFIVFYGIDGSRYLAGLALGGGTGRVTAIGWRVLAVAYVVWFVGLGTTRALAGVRQAHTSPFGAYPIKRPENFDAQRVAFWVRDHTGQAEPYASAQRDMYDVLTERRGHDLVPSRTSPADAFLAWLEREGVRHILLDHTLPGVRDSLLAIVRDYPDRFQPMLELPGAAVYRVRVP